ncbi:hypothetical protein HUK80_12430 [Flavobacterium sp. MAH-1]|uniref:Uncharacterized protein n=1 Tax=Flavobacterium agri TaxID=2743471 RepID=A0A7Y9C5X4_9FLAO|nr:hypothetical protein [Flavobacterium agri]NUY81707.1 hypothetical protein [Flavobacterium agri]NYA71731.1 hypothetical protein [Flavobacterium agri]
MARNKMEKEFSEKLNQREIQPSSAAWDRLDAMLSAAEAQPQVVKIKRSFKWLYVAAGFLGFLLVGTLFFRQGDTKAIDNGNHQVVETAKTPVQKPSHVKIEAQPKVQIAENSSEVSETAKATAPSVRRKIEKVNSVQEQKAQLADNTINQNQSSNSIIDQKTDKLNQANPQIASSATADELLANAQAKREAQVKGVKVNAKSLLSQVDSQAEEKLTLRQKALRALNKNYQQVKVAVENRNLEENH